MADKSILSWNEKQGRFFVILFYLTAFLFLLLLYINYIIPVWSYYGFRWKPNPLKMAEGILLLLTCLLVFPSKIKRTSDVLIHLQFMFPVMPMLVLYGAANLARVYIYCVIICMLLLNASRFIFVNISSRGLISPRSMIIGGMFASYFLIIIIIMLGGWKYINFDIFKVYEYRRVASSNLPKYFGYIVPSICNVFLPFSLVLALKLRKYFVVILSAMGSVLMFGLLQHKSVLFAPVFVISTYYILSKHKRFLLYILVASDFVLIASWVDTMIGETCGTIASLFLRRVYFVPASANFGYYDFFSKHPFVMFSNSKLTLGLIEYPYKVPYQLLIGQVGGFEGVWANTGWLGTSYMHFGYAGMLIYAFLIGIIFKIIDRLGAYKGNALVLSLILIPCWTLFLSADLPTALLTHGVFLSIFLVFLLKLPSERAGSI